MNEQQGNEAVVELPGIGEPGVTGETGDPIDMIVISDTGDARDPGIASEMDVANPAMDPITAIDAGALAAGHDPLAASDGRETAQTRDIGETNEVGETGETPDSTRQTVRKRLIEQFEQWLDRMEEGEPPPEGIPQEIIDEAQQAPAQEDGLTSDLYSLFSALTLLSGEVRLQGRTFKSLTDALAPIAQLPGRLERIESAQGIVVQDLARRAAAESQSAGPKSKDVLGVMFDLYDRLERGMRTFEAGVDSLRAQTFTGWRQRLLGGAEQAKALLDSANAIEEGYRLTLSRLDAAFTQWGVERIAEVGEMFDPNRMAVIEVAPSPGDVDGTVLEVYKSGYLLHGQMLTTAQVKVCRNA